MLQLVVYIPKTHLNSVRDAMLKAGGGRFKNYDLCCFTTEGVGQFRPLEKSHPYLGKKDEICKVEEFRVEMVCAKEHLDKVLEAMHIAHPYEEVAYSVLQHFSN